MTDSLGGATPEMDALIADVRLAVEGVTARFTRQDYLQHYRDRTQPTRLYAVMAEQGLFALGVDEEIGGAGGGLVATAAVMESMSRAGIPPMLFSLTSFARQAILRHGTREQIEEHVIPSLNAERTFCFAITEPEAGTNSFAMRTFAEPQPGGGYRVNGQKVFISGADQADYITLVARTTPADQVERRSDGISLFVLPRDTPGVTMTEMSIDWKAPERQFSVWFDNVELPASSLVGPEGKGLRTMFSSLNAERVVIAAWALGLGDFVLDRAVRYAKERAPWGAPIGGYQAVSHPLAKAKMQLEAARVMNYRAAAAFDRGEDAGADANIAKFLASEAAFAAVDAAIQAHGGAGFDEDSDVITMFPMIRILRVAPINNEMVLNFVAQSVLGLPRSY